MDRYPFEQQQRAYEDYANAYHTRDYSRVDPREAMGIVQHFQQSASPEVVHDLFEHYFERLPPELRLPFIQQMPVAYQANPNNPRSMAQSFTALIQQQRGGLDQGARQEGAMGDPLSTGILMGIAALAATSLPGSHERGRTRPFWREQSHWRHDDDDHDDEYEEGDGRRSRRRRGGGLGDILGDLLGGE